MAQKNLKEAFAASLKTFVGSTKTSMKAASQCAAIALEQFKLHGDLSLCQQFYENMPKNYVRRAAYLKWLKHFAPVTMDGESKKLVKDKSEAAISHEDIDLEAACKQEFWDFAPDPEQVLWQETDLVKSLRSTVKKYHKDHYKAASETAKKSLERAEDFINELDSQTQAA